MEKRSLTQSWKGVTCDVVQLEDVLLGMPGSTGRPRLDMDVDPWRSIVVKPHPGSTESMSLTLPCDSPDVRRPPKIVSSNAFS